MMPNDLGMSRGPWRLKVICTLKFSGPLHIGSGEHFDPRTDAPVLRNASGDPWLRGSSVRGVLRDWCEREAAVLGIERVYVDRLFGRTPRKDKPLDMDRQGRLTVLDASVESAPMDIRDHVRMDSCYGAAAKGGKFDQEVAHPGFAHVELIYEGDGPSDPETRLLHSAVQALKDGILHFGAKSGWGFGWVECTDDSWKAVTRDNEPDLAKYLAARLGASATDTDVRDVIAAVFENDQHSPLPANGGPHPMSWLKLTLWLRFNGPMLIADLYRGDDVNSPESQADHTYRVGHNLKPYLPGSSVRGTLRSYAERIGRTLGEGAERVVKTLLGTEEQRGLLRIAEGAILEPYHTVLSNHVAIDRVTGFAADEKLFSDVGLASPCFRTKLLVRWDPADQMQRAAVALLLFLLRDLQKGLLWVGSRTTRGYGHLRGATIESVRQSRVRVADGVRRREPTETLTVDSLTRLESALTEEFESWREIALIAI